METPHKMQSEATKDIKPVAKGKDRKECLILIIKKIYFKKPFQGLSRKGFAYSKLMMFQNHRKAKVFQANLIS